MTTNSTSFISVAMILARQRPMRPKPLIATRMGIITPSTFKNRKADGAAGTA
jgi:hypothetical protein